MATMDEFGQTFTVALTAIGTGCVFGYVLQRGGFCLTRALSNLFIMQDARIARAYLLALLVAMAGTHVLISLGLVEMPIRPFHWLANVVGGFIFGVGMILSGGCSGSTWYRVGEGAIGAVIVLLGFAMGATATSVGILAPLRQTLQDPEILIDGSAPTLATLIGLAPGVSPSLAPWLIIVGFGIVVALLFRRGESEPEHGKWPWPMTGIAVGLMIALGWLTSSVGGSPTGITFAINTGHLLTYPLVRYPNQINWSMWLLPGVVLGSFIAAWRAREFGWKLPKAESLSQLFAGGLIMGIGGILGEGCNITQGLTNSATLALGSLTTFGAIILGAWVTIRMMFPNR
jgi:uncharacterized membrane protein YedE/YeeE